MSNYQRGTFCLAFIIVTSMFNFSFVGAGNSMNVEADIIANPPVISVQVPDRVYLGSVSPGGETNRTKVSLNNTGNVAIVITPILTNSSEVLMKNIYFARRTTESYKKVGDFSMNLSKPTTPGGVEEDYFYMKLDLTNYNQILTKNLTGYTSEIVFYAVEQ